MSIYICILLTYVVARQIIVIVILFGRLQERFVVWSENRNASQVNRGIRYCVPLDYTIDLNENFETTLIIEYTAAERDTITIGRRATSTLRRTETRTEKYRLRNRLINFVYASPRVYASRRRSISLQTTLNRLNHIHICKKK